MAQTRILTLFLFSIFLFITTTISEPVNLPTISSAAAALLSFKATVSDPSGLLHSWNADSEPCTSRWAGIVCIIHGPVIGLFLTNFNLSGPLNLDPLTSLPSIRYLIFTGNSFTGPIPDLKGFKKLSRVYISGTKLSGEIPDDAFEGMSSLKRVVLSRNEFSGRIPSSLARVESLQELRLDNNGFVGEIPNFRQLGLTVVNFSNNQLEGKIPDVHCKMNVRMFEGNSDLCGPPTEVPCETPSPSPLEGNIPQELGKMNASMFAGEAPAVREQSNPLIYRKFGKFKAKGIYVAC